MNVCCLYGNMNLFLIELRVWKSLDCTINEKWNLKTTEPCSEHWHRSCSSGWTVPPTDVCAQLCSGSGTDHAPLARTMRTGISRYFVNSSHFTCGIHNLYQPSVPLQVIHDVFMLLLYIDSLFLNLLERALLYVLCI